jgi:hypothetical protein
MVSADGTGIVSQAGGLLLTRTLRATGLDRGLDTALERWRPARAVHSPGKIITDLAVAAALGGDCLADVAILRAQPELAGPVAYDPVISWLVTHLAADAPRALKGHPRGAGRRPAAGLGPGRRRSARRGRRPGHRGHRRDDRDLVLGERAGHADAEENLRASPADRLR